MKKITSVLLVIGCLLLCLTACSASPQELVTEAMENAKTLDAYEATLEMNIVVTANGEVMTVPMNMDLKIKDARSENPTAYIKLSSKVMDREVTQEMYMEGDWIYLTQNGASYKMNRSSAEDAADGMTDTMDDFAKDFPEEVYDSAEVVSNDDGSQTVSLSLPDALFKELYDDMIESITNSIAPDAELTNLTISNVRVDITVKDAQVQVYDIRFDMGMNIEGMAVTAVAQEKLTFTKTGDAVVITPMEGYQDFTDITSLQ